MLRYTTSLILLVCIIKMSFSQCCTPENIEFTTQAEIDNFQVNYPGCTGIEGDVTIHGDDITNLDGLSVVTNIEGTLLIKKNSSLSLLTGLGNLKHVESLMIIDNDALVTLRGLESLNEINGHVHIWYNDLITDLRGLDSITYVGSDLMIEGNYSLLNCHGLEKLTSVEGSLVIGCIAGWMHYNRSLRTLSGFDNLNIVQGLLWINCNDSLVNLTGLESLVSVGDGLVINGNKSLVNLTGLEQLNSCGGRLIIGGWWEDCAGNPRLTSLQGIENIDPLSISELRIRNNNSLTLCNIKCICDYLLNPDATVVITENATACNGIAEVKQACESQGVRETSNLNIISVHPNPCVKGDITIKISRSDEHSPRLLTCFNTFGESAFEQEVHPLQNEFIINTSDWQPGIYLVVISSKGKSESSSKFVIQ